MPPIDGQPQGPPQAGAGTIQLSTLIDFSIQRTYHELTVLSELLPRKTDMERKIEIVQFASRTRQLFVRLLALVKWANSASKVDKCGQISTFLDKQAMLFVETADMLARVAHETRMHARLPSFSIPCAIDVLTTGTYPRLPTCIKERIVPPDPITPQEKRETLQRLDQIIQYRLVTSELPPQMKNLRIANGRVKFLVEHEFEVTLTLMGDGPTIPWRLLDIDVLVEDHETGDGKALVHSLQVNYIHQLVQSRLLENDRPLHDLYNCLHSFCQSLQLEVLHSQTQRLINQRLGDHIRIEEYIAGKCLVLSYWRNQPRKEKEVPIIYKLRIHVDEANPGKPLQVTHVPEILGKESYKVAQAIKSDHLSVEKLLVHTIQVRGQAKLRDLEKEIKRYSGGPCELKGVPPVLQMPILHPCMESEKMTVCVDVHRGTYLVHVQQYGSRCKLSEEIEESLNSGGKDLQRLITQLRLWLALHRCEKSVQHVPSASFDRLPFVHTKGHPIDKLGQAVLFVKLLKHNHFYIVVEAKEKGFKSVEYDFHMLQVEPAPFENAEDDVMEDLPHPFFKPKLMLKLDTFALTHGPCAKIHDVEFDENESENALERKRKILLGDTDGPPRKIAKVASYFIPELVYVLAMFEDRIPFISLGDELQKRCLPHQGIEVGGNGTCVSLTLVDLPVTPETEALRKDLLSCTFRIQGKARMWLAELIFSNCPLKSSNPKEAGPVHRVYGSYDLSISPEGAVRVVQDFLDDWSTLGHLYSSVVNFAALYNDPLLNMHNMVEVKSFSYKKLILAYGPNKTYTVTIMWKQEESLFHLSLGTLGHSSTSNCHTLVAKQLEAEFNQNKSISWLAQVLHETWAPLTAICKLPTNAVLGLSSKSQQPNPSFSILPQSPTHVRIAFRNTYCIDIHMKAGKVVAVRDGAYSLFDTSKVVDKFTPTAGLKTFLNLFVDDSSSTSLSRRRSTTEDDNPPSPIGMDTMDSFMSQSQTTGSPAKKPPDASGLRFPGPMTPPSNPHTPASPSTGLRQSSVYSPAAAFPLSSPPSMQSAVTPSPAMMGTPSPGILGAGSPGNPQLHVPSPGSFVPAPSPSSLGIHMPSPAGPFISPQGMVEAGSPYPGNLVTPSPGARNWPGSPSVPGPSPASRHMSAHSPGSHQALHSPPSARDGVMSPPSRILPQRSWAASIPTMLSHDALNKLLTPTTTPGVKSAVLTCCPLERFLGCVYIRRHMQRVVQSEDTTLSLQLQHMQASEPGVIMFKSDSLQFKVSLNTNTQQVLHMKCTPTMEYKDQWSHDELTILERFFEIKVACPPYKSNAVTAFGKLLGAPVRILRDCIQLMKLELMPDRHLKWSVQWCLTISPGSPPITPVGTPAVFLRNNKMFLMLQLTRMMLPGQQMTGESPTLVVPILYDMTNNTTTMVEKTTAQGQQPLPQTLMSVNVILKRFAEFNSNMAECTIYPAIREVLANLTVQ